MRGPVDLVGSDSKESAHSAGDPGSIPGLEIPLEKGMATHSSILAWRIPWTAEPDGLQFIAFQRVGHDWATNTHWLSWVPGGDIQAQNN